MATMRGGKMVVAMSKGTCDATNAARLASHADSNLMQPPAASPRSQRLRAKFTCVRQLPVKSNSPAYMTTVDRPVEQVISTSIAPSHQSLSIFASPSASSARHNTLQQLSRPGASCSSHRVEKEPNKRSLISIEGQTQASASKIQHRSSRALAIMSGGRYISHSPPTRLMSTHAAPEASAYARNVAPGQGNGHTSPRTQLPSIHSLPPEHSFNEGDESFGSKRRRLDDPARMHAPSILPDGENDDQHRLPYDSRYTSAAPRPSAPRGGASSAAFPPSPSQPLLDGAYERFPSGSGRAFDDKRPDALARDRGYAGEDSTDTSVPLARRRGDAAQAKASRLHIDTGYSTESQESGQGHLLERDHLGASRLAHGATRSAPPHKMTFAEREHALSSSTSFDPRDERPPPHFVSRAPSAYFQGSPDSSQLRRGERTDSVYTGQGWESINAQSRRDLGPPSGSVSTHPTGGAVYRGASGQGSVTTPLTAARASAFLPQTATLPSPAYHSTQFGRPTSGGAPHGLSLATSSSSLGGQANASSGNGATSSGGQPRTAGPGNSAAPLTGRLPDHVRSPPSSKTQFLSLFSNFYDSLSDSRTLKATLEDQVRRSNTLLQTLQRSARVLELTVDRRLQEERAVWEKKVEALESRCRRLEGKLDLRSPTPLTRSDSRRASTSMQAGSHEEQAQGDQQDHRSSKQSKGSSSSSELSSPHRNGSGSASSSPRHLKDNNAEDAATSTSRTGGNDAPDA